MGSLSEEALEAFSQFHHGVVILRGGVNRGPVLLVSKLGKQVAVSVKALVVKVGVGSRLHHDSAFGDVWREGENWLDGKETFPGREREK